MLIIGQIKLFNSTFYDIGNIPVVYMADMGKEVMLNLKIQPADKP